jgi:hypothetical protein
MEKAPILISKPALLARINHRTAVRAVDARYSRRGTNDCVLLIYYNNGDVREFKGLRAA